MKNYIWRFAASLFLTTLSIAPTYSESLSGPDLAAALRTGGYVILMRHASSPRNPPDARTANADNPTLERQLDEGGRSSAQALGEALRQLRIRLVRCGPARPIVHLRRSSSRTWAQQRRFHSSATPAKA